MNTLLTKFNKDIIIYDNSDNLSFPKGKYVTLDQYYNLLKELRSANVKIDKLNLALSFCKNQNKALEQDKRKLIK